MRIFIHKIKTSSTRYEYLNRLQVVLADKPITNRWLAEQLDVSEVIVFRWKTSKIQPSMSQFVRIAQVLSIDVMDLIESPFNN